MSQPGCIIACIVLLVFAFTYYIADISTGVSCELRPPSGPRTARPLSHPNYHQTPRPPCCHEHFPQCFCCIKPSRAHDWLLPPIVVSGTAAAAAAAIHLHPTSFALPFLIQHSSSLQVSVTAGVSCMILPAPTSSQTHCEHPFPERLLPRIGRHSVRGQ